METLVSLIDVVRGNGYLCFFAGLVAAVAYGLCKLAALLPTL